MNDRHIEFGPCACPICSGDFVAEPVDAEAIADKPVLDNDQVIDQMDTGRSWSTNIISFGFLLSGPTWDEGFEADGFSEFTDTQKAVARLTLALWDDLIAPSLVEQTEDPEYADINFGNTTTYIGYAHAYYPGTVPYAGETWYNAENDPELYDPDPGEYDWTTYLHEIGHALGLSHPGAYNAGDDEVITYETHAEYARDTEQWTVMSYFGASYTGADWNGGAGWRHAQTPMVHDILAIQSIYGADTTTRTGNTVYGFNSNAGNDLFDFSLNQYPVLTIYDAGGIDTLDLSGFTLRSIIDLTPGNYSSAGGTTSTMTFNIGIAIDTWIENAIGGSGNDTLIGNSLSNRLTGGAGADMLDGGEGGDVLNGGAGADILDGGDDRDWAFYTGSSSGVTVNLDDSEEESGGHAEGDTLTSIESIYGSAYNDTLIGDSASNVFRGGAGNDRLYGGAGADTLRGDAGNDVLTGGIGADTLDGGTGRDWAFYTESDAGVNVNLDDGLAETGGHAEGDTLISIESIYGSVFDDTLIGNGASNVFRGGAGNDTLMGGGGADTLRGDDGFDTLSGGIGADTLDGGDDFDWVSYSDSDAGVSVDLGDSSTESGGHAEGDTLLNIEAVEGSDFKDFLAGNDVDNSLKGGAGNDVLVGGAGADTLDGGEGRDWANYTDSDAGVTVNLDDNDAEAGGHAEGDTLISIECVSGSDYNDTIIGNSASNFLVGGSGNDTLSGGEGNDILRGDAGNDILTGGSGEDTFRFTSHDGDDTITDFEAGIDIISFDSTVASFADLTISDQGGDTVVSYEGGSITLEGIDHTLVTADYFLF